jgi:polysaccharide export outer membrane protein
MSKNYNASLGARFSRSIVGTTLALALACAGVAHGQETPARAAPPGSGEYLIGPGDTLNVDVWRQPELSVTVPVRPDGRISTPLVEDLVAVGKTPTQLGRDIEGVLSEFIRTPQVTVIVEGFVGVASAQIRVLGQVTNPGPIAYRDGMTLLDVMLAAGGLAQFAAGNRSTLTRTVDGKVVKIKIRLARLLEKGELGENIPVRPGDVIVVPEAVF